MGIFFPKIFNIQSVLKGGCFKNELNSFDFCFRTFKLKLRSLLPGEMLLFRSSISLLYRSLRAEMQQDTSGVPKYHNRAQTTGPPNHPSSNKPHLTSVSTML